MEAEQSERHTFRSPSGAMELEADTEVLLVKARVQVRPIFVAMGVFPIVAAAGYVLFREGASPGPIVIATGLLVWAAYIVNRSRTLTTLRLVGKDAAVMESRIFTTRHRRIKLRPDLDATAESTTDGNDGFINFVRLKGERSSKLDLLRGHTAEDVVWAWAAINHWRRGGPHGMALHLSALARSK